MKLILCFTIMVLLAVANATPVHRYATCRKLMEENGLSDRFPGAVAHGIHSLTLEDVRFYFKPDATEKNGVPTLNYDLTAKQGVLPNAVLYGYDTTFKTIGMRHLDQVMRNMERKDFYLANYNTLEKLVHTIHMSEIWAKTKEMYDKLPSQDFDLKFCRCVTDKKNNGVEKMLSFMWLKIKYPGITSGLQMQLPRGIADWSGNLYRYNFFNKWNDKLAAFDFNRTTAEVLKDASVNLVDGDTAMSHLDSEKAWEQAKDATKKMVERDNYELAVFLHCTLRA